MSVKVVGQVWDADDATFRGAVMESLYDAAWDWVSRYPPEKPGQYSSFGNEFLRVAEAAYLHVADLVRPLEPYRPARTRRYISRAVRERVFARAVYRCESCGAVDRLQVDHRVPWSRGGGNDEANLGVLCAPCNVSKGTRTLDEWRAI